MDVPVVRFNGTKGKSPTERWPTSPLVEPIGADEHGRIVGRGWLPGDELEFTKNFAAGYGRVCECHGDGTCFAYQHAGAWSFTYDDPETFTVYFRASENQPAPSSEEGEAVAEATTDTATTPAESTTSTDTEATTTDTEDGTSTDAEDTASTDTEDTTQRSE